MSSCCLPFLVKPEEELGLARLHRFARRNEQDVDRIFNEAEEAADEDGADSHNSEVIDIPDTGLPPVESTTGQKRGRRPLPQNLPRERVEYDLPDDQNACPCCREQMHRMGEAVTEQLHIEVKAKVLQNVRFKCACRHCDRTGINTTVVTAPMPVQPLPGRIARPRHWPSHSFTSTSTAHCSTVWRRPLNAPVFLSAVGSSRPLGGRFEREASASHL